MRREGYELAVSKPQVIVTERDGERWEPVEYVVVDVPEAYAGAVIEALGRRKATMSNMLTVGRRAAARVHDADARHFRTARRAA